VHWLEVMFGVPPDRPDERTAMEYSHSEWEALTLRQKEAAWDRHWQRREAEDSSETQAEHDARHPGMICQQCPKNLASEQRLRDLTERLRLPWYKRWFR